MMRHAARAALIAAAPLLSPMPALADPAQVVSTPGRGTLTLCRDWLVSRRCSIYHHVALPARITVGDQLSLTFGTSAKSYEFRVERIDAAQGGCTIWNNPNGSPGDRIEVASCSAEPNVPKPGS